MINHGHGIALDVISHSDIWLLQRWRNNPEIFNWCRQNDLINDTAQEDWFQKISTDPSVKMYVIRDTSTQLMEHVGVCGLTSIDLHNRRAEFSLYIGTRHQRKGFARKALMTLLDHGFDTLNLYLIWGETFIDNPALNLFTSLGFLNEGIKREFYFKNGKYIDCHHVSIKSEERPWKNSFI